MPPLLRTTFSRALTAILMALLATIALAVWVVVPVSYQNRLTVIAGITESTLAAVKAVEQAVGFEEGRRRLIEQGLLVRPFDASGQTLMRAGSFSGPLGGKGAADLSRALGVQVQIDRSTPGNHILWVRRADLMQGNWLGIRRLRDPLFTIWYSVGLWSALTLVFAALAAICLSLTVSRPLRSLAEAASAAAGHGEPLRWRSAGPVEIRRLGRILADATERLDRHYREQQLILSAASHDMRTPLSRLRFAVDLLPDSEQSLAQDMRSDIAEIDTQLGEFLSLSRQGVLEQPTEIDLADLLQSLARRHAELGRQVYYRGPGSLKVLLRPRALQWALRALLQNALEHGDEPVDLLLRADGQGLELDVRDHGHGVPDDALETLGRHGPGPRRGFGLVMVRRLVEGMGGQLELLRATPGLRARLRLPRASR